MYENFDQLFNVVIRKNPAEEKISVQAYIFVIENRALT